MANRWAAQNAANRQRLKRQLRIATQFPDEVAEASMRIIGEDLVAEVKGSLVEPGTGRTYVRYNPRRVHVASAPFEPPASDLGRLMGSYKVIRIGKKPVNFVEVGSHVSYAPYLEFGTRHMLPRPHLRPAASRTAKKIPAILAAVARVKVQRLRSGL